MSDTHMRPVITAEQAKKITRGRTPLVPVEYEEACKQLAACRTLDEAKYWDNKADALAAWAKIYRNDQAGRDARRLKLHAYRRMGDLARELRPLQHGSRTGGIKGGSQPGASALLQEKGLNKSQSQSALRISRMPESVFTTEINAEKPRAPSVLGVMRPGVSKEYELFKISAMSFRSCLRKRGDAAEFSRTHVPAQDSSMIREWCVEVVEWLDRLEHSLPKEKNIESGSIKGKLSKDIIDGYFDVPVVVDAIRNRHKISVGGLYKVLAEMIAEGYLKRSERGGYQIAHQDVKNALRSEIFEVQRNPLE